MRKAKHLGAVLASCTMAAAGALAIPATANAGAYDPAGPAVQFWAEALGNCKVDFTIANTTNVTSFTIDWRIDNEPLRSIEGVPFEVGRTGGMHSTVLEGPRWPDDISTMGENTEDNRWMKSGFAVSEVTYTRDLKDLPGYNPPLPNPEADTHLVEYRIVLGPPGTNGENPDETVEWLGDRQWKSVTVNGCATPDLGPNPGPGPSLLGSLTSLFGNFGS